MQDQNNPEKPHRRKKNQGLPKSILIVITLLLLIIFGIGIFFFSGPEKVEEQLPPESLDTSASLSTTGDDNGVEIDSDLDTVSVTTTPDTIGEEQLVDGPPIIETATETPEEKRAKECRILAEQVHGFFAHVDSEDYIQQFELNKTSQNYFITLAFKLLKNPPVVSRESDDLYTILKNMAHFFRVIGKDNIILIKTILDRERDKIEDVAAELYQWTAWGDCNDDLLKFSPTLEQMYEYAGFFLNTMGGRSYLFRRDSRSRLLVNYYSVLLIERANKQGVNRHGIDITQIIPQLIQEIEGSNQLIYKENYIDSLDVLLEKYQ